MCFAFAGSDAVGDFCEICLMSLVLTEFFDVSVYAVEFMWNVDALRAVACALSAADAAVCLSQLRDGPVVAYQIGPACLAVIFRFRPVGNFTLVDALVVVQQYCRNVDSVWAWHAVFAVIAWDGRVLEHKFGSFFKKCQLIFVKRDKRGVCLEIIL